MFNCSSYCEQHWAWLQVRAMHDAATSTLEMHPYQQGGVSCRSLSR